MQPAGGFGRPAAHSRDARAPSPRAQRNHEAVPGVVANDAIDFDLRRGEVHALLGENGAGKSTLMNVLYGLYRPTRARSSSAASPSQLELAADAIDRGIGMVHQHFMLVPVMTVAENIVLATSPRTGGLFLDARDAASGSRSWRRASALPLDPGALVEDITVGQQQRVEILKALYRRRRHPDPRRAHRGADAAGGDRAVRDPRTLKRRGHVDHLHLAQAQRGARDRGSRSPSCGEARRSDTLPAAGATEAGLARLMVGREVLLRVEKGAVTPGDPVLEVEDLHVRDDRGLERFAGSRSRFGRARSSASPASTATARRS